MTSLHVFYSNQIEILFQQLKFQLFHESTPFSKRMIIVPSTAMKTWIQLQMALDPQLGIAFGVEIHLLETAVQKLLPKEGEEPTILALTFALESTMEKVLNHPDQYQSPHWKVLLDYLNLDSARLPRRICALSATLAKLFAAYGNDAAGCFSNWQTGQPSFAWQKHLWEEMEKLYAPWNYPNRKLKVKNIQCRHQIHLFGFSFLSKNHHQFFKEITGSTKVNYYLPSPCCQFWRDVLSDKESMRLRDFWHKQNVPESNQLHLEELLRDKNALLANFGRLGREFLAQFDSDDFQTGERYLLPAGIQDHQAYSDLISDAFGFSGNKHPLTMLEAVQADIALLRNPKTTEKVVFESNDHTIEVHAVPKQIREVQVVYDIIMNIIDRHRSSEIPVTPQDILVMAPDISLYSPMINHVFHNPESRLEVNLINAKPLSQYPLIQGYRRLLQLATGRLEISDFLQLLEHQGFCKRQGFTDDDIIAIKQWIISADIRWGCNIDHRNALLKRKTCKNKMGEDLAIGTWEHGLGRLLEGLAVSSTEEHSEDLPFSPLEGISSNQSELFGQFIELFHSLVSDLEPLVDGTKLTLVQWSHYLQSLAYTYLIFQGSADEEQRLLSSHLEIFKNASPRLENERFSYQSIGPRLNLSFEETVPQFGTNSNLQSVRFSQLLPMHTVPAKVIILMGMHDGAFPGKNQESSMNFLNRTPKAEYQPSQSDFDRYLFLEALLSARQYFIMTYISEAPSESHEQLPSLLVNELLEYMDEAFALPQGSPSSRCFTQHPIVPFHHSYFTADTSFKSYSQSYYRAALAHSGTNKKQAANLLTAFPKPAELLSLLPSRHVSLGDLNAFLKNPLKIYCNHVLKIHLNNGDDRLKTEEELLVSPIHRSLIVKGSVFGDAAHVLSRAEKAGKLPKGPFYLSERDTLHREIEEMKSTLRTSGIDTENIFSIDFSPKYLSPSYDGRKWKIPPLHVTGNFFNQVALCGHIEYVSKNGLILFAHDEFEEAVKCWPLIAAFNHLIHTYDLDIQPQVIFVKKAKAAKKPLNFGNPGQLVEILLDYYLKNNRILSPLLPEWTYDIMQASVDALTEKFKKPVNDEFYPIYNEYLRWLKMTSPGLAVETAITHWQPVAQNLFAEMEKAWYSRSK